MKTIVYQNFEETLDVTLEVGTYLNNTLAIDIIVAETGECWTTATLNREVPMPYGVAIIKNYSENEGIFEWLKKNNLIKEHLFSYDSGFVSCPVVIVNMEKLAEFDPKGTAKYKRLHKNFKQIEKQLFEKKASCLDDFRKYQL